MLLSIFRRSKIFPFQLFTETKRTRELPGNILKDESVSSNMLKNNNSSIQYVHLETHKVGITKVSIYPSYFYIQALDQVENLFVSKKFACHETFRLYFKNILSLSKL